jgi:hypothetical protein
MLNKKREKMVTHENRFCLEGVCPSQFFIFPDQTGTATSSPHEKVSSPKFERSVWLMCLAGYNACYA